MFLFQRYLLYSTERAERESLSNLEAWRLPIIHMVDRSTLACDLCHLSYCNYIVLMFYVLFGIKSELYIEVMVHGAMEHVVVKLSVKCM